ncbi:hypothetical protein [Methylocella sp.]|jgi:hypothetical protein|uniref:hypothetical protein n=1 Tax=Methylocella sp. TaxID=1978226 RepID=UPI003C19F4FB
MTDLSDLAARETEIAEKTKVITHLTQTLSHTRSCLEIARTALQSIADEGKKGGVSESHARCCEIASEALGRI